MKFLPIVGAPYAKKATLLRHGYDMASPAAQDAYLNALRRALLHLYDPVELRRSPLFDLLGLPAGADRVGALRKTLHDAIQALKPGRQVSVDSQARRIYEILTYRYVEQSSQKEVAADLALSIRQLQRLEGMALEALAAYLSERYALSPERLGMLDGPRSGPVEDPVEAQDEPAASERLAQELAWLERSSHPEEIDIQALLVEIMETLSPLIEKQSVEVVVNFPTPPPCLVGDSAILRPAFLTLLSAFLQECPKAQVKFTGRTQEASFAIDIWVKGDQKKPTGAGQAAGGRLAGERDLLQQLFRLAGGELEIFPSMPGHPSAHILARLRLPGMRCRSVLALDDNADALALLERYLSGGLYQFRGVRDPAEFLAVAEALRPEAILLDVMLPGVDGWQILGRLKAAPQTQNIPVVVSTILPQAELALMLGADAFLRKPFTRSDLLAVLNQLPRVARQS